MGLVKLDSFTRNTASQNAGPGQVGSVWGPAQSSYDFFSCGTGTSNTTSTSPATNPKFVTALVVPANSLLHNLNVATRHVGTGIASSHFRLHLRPLSQINSSAYALNTDYKGTANGVSGNADGLVGEVSIAGGAATAEYFINFSQIDNRTPGVANPDIDELKGEWPANDGTTFYIGQELHLDTDCYLTFEISGPTASTAKTYEISASALFSTRV